jgi:hypothetical protein
MKVNTDSWHYKLNRYTWGSNIPQHLCPYARLLLFNILLGGWMQYLFDHININFQMPDWGIERTIKAFMRHNRWFFNIKLVYGLWAMWGVYHLLSGEVTLGLVSLGMTGGTYAIVRTSGRGVKFFESKSTKFKSISEKSIVLQSVKSNHDRICPKLDFVDNTIVQFNEEVSQIKEPELEDKQVIKNEQKNKLLKFDSEV